MTIYFDMTELLNAWVKRPAGIVRVMIETAEAFMDDPRVRFVGYTSRSKRLIAVPRPMLRARIAMVRDGRKTGPLFDFWQQVHHGPLAGIAAIRPRAGDILVFAALVSADAKRKKMTDRLIMLEGVKSVFVVHDLIPHVLPDTIADQPRENFARYLETLMRPGSHALCISQHTEKDLRAEVARRGTGPGSIARLALGFELGDKREGKLPAEVATRIGDDYCLLVSTIEPRKQHLHLKRVWQHLAQQGRALPKLVFAGGWGWNYDAIKAEIDSDEARDLGIVILNGLTDDELGALYAGARFTLYPSIYEGWGLPISESLLYGKLCLASDNSSLPEAGAGLADLLPTGDVQAWADLVAYYLDHPEALAAKEDAIRSHFKPRLWSEFGEDFKTELARIAGYS